MLVALIRAGGTGQGHARVRRSTGHQLSLPRFGHKVIGRRDGDRGGGACGCGGGKGQAGGGA